MTYDRQVEAAALDWVIRQRDHAFSDWEAFTDWLAADPAHAEAYHEVAALDAELDGLPPEVEPSESFGDTDNVVALPRRMNRRLWFSGAVAASLVGLLSLTVLKQAPDSYRIQTAMGETRTIELEDGSRIALNGGTAMLLSRGDPRSATLEHGQALFTVVHRTDAPFRVAVGKAQLIDIGTVFDVTRANGQTSVAVSEGAVAYRAGSNDIRVDAGRRLVVREESQQAEVGATDAAAVGGWTSGQLSYSGATLAQVASEIARTTGIRVRIAPDASEIVFRGVIQTGLPEERLIGDLAALSGTHAHHGAEGWTLSK